MTKIFAAIDRIFYIYDRLDESGVTRWPRDAAALSYYMALSVVPFLAICFALAKSFNMEVALMTALSENFSGQEAIIGPLKGFAENLINSFSGSLLAFVALAVIFWSGYRLLAQLESSLGVIYGYRPQRLFVNRIAGYLSIMLVIPMLLVAAGTINVFLAGLAQSTWGLGGFSFSPGSVLPVVFILSPYLVWWIVLSWLYAYFSRGIMGWPERLLAGLIAACLFQLFQAFYLKLMFALSSYNAVYGSFAAVPLFMVWLYSSWLIVMLGAEICRRFSDKFSIGLSFWHLAPPPCWTESRAVVKNIMAEVFKNFEAEPKGEASSMRQLSLATGAPLPHLGYLVVELVEAGILARVKKKGYDGPAFLPAGSREHLTDAKVFKALDERPLWS